MGNQATHGLSPMVIEGLEQETAFTASELAVIHRQFQHECPDGKMRAEDFKVLYNNHFPDGDASKFAEHVFRVFDRDGDGEVTFAEFITTLGVQLKGTKEEKLGWAFDLYDTNHHGYINKAELRNMIQSMHQLNAHLLPMEDQTTTDQLTEHIMSKADKEHDGRVTRNEFVEAALESKTLQCIIKGELQAASSPYLVSKGRRGSYCLPELKPRTRTGSIDSKE